MWSPTKQPPLSKESAKSTCKALVLNSGSSSLKYGLFRIILGKAECVCSGLVDRIGLLSSSITHKDADGTRKVDVDVPDHSSAITQVVELLTSSQGLISNVADITVVGHRVVHGGPLYSTPAVVDEAVERAIERCIPLAPLHNPHNLLGIRVAQKHFPCPHVAVFDTAFHATIPEHNYTYALPRELCIEHNLRRYGFHGTSYTYVLKQTAKLLHRPAEELNMIILHLGNGASMAAIRKGACIDTTMGMTPLEGLVMGTRCGDVDGGVATFLASNLGYSAADIDKLFNKQSGLQGLCGSSDMRAIKAKAEAGVAECQLARRIAIERIRKYLGAFLVKLNGEVDAIVFTGGMGENDAELRDEVCADLQTFGISVDSTKNKLHLSEIQSSFAIVKCMVVPTSEELSIALQSAEAIGVLPTTGEEVTSKPFFEKTSLSTSTAKAPTGKVAPLGHALMIEGDQGTVLVEAALLTALLPRSSHLGYFRMLTLGEGRDYKLDFMRGVDKLGFHKEPVDAMVGMTMEEANALFARGLTDEIYSTIIDKFKAYSANKDFVIVSGQKITTRGARGGPGSFEFYAQLAAALNMPALSVHDARTDRIYGAALGPKLAGIRAAFEQSNVRLAGAIVTGLPADDFEAAERATRESLENQDIYPAALLPHDDRLYQLTMGEIAHELDAKVLFGESNIHNQFVRNVEVGTMQVPDLLAVLQQRPGTLVITSVARTEVLLSLVFAARSSNMQLHPGVILTGAAELPKTVQHVLDGVGTIRKPVLITTKSTYEVTAMISELRKLPHPLANGYAKLETAETLLEKHLDVDFREAMIIDMPVEDISPIILKHKMFTAVRKSKQRIVLPEGDDTRIVVAAGELISRGLCDVTLIGEEKSVKALAESAHVCIDGATIIDPNLVLKDSRTSWGDAMVDELYEKRKHKGMTLEKAREILRSDPAYFGTMMMIRGMADGMVSGACHSTANTMRPALQLIKTAPGFSLVSSVFFMLLRDKVYVYGDCAINVDPTAEQLADIAIASVQTARAFGIVPRVAMLSYASGDSNQGPMIDKVRQATELARKLAPDELIEGPIQFDAAVDPAVAAVKYKGLHSPVAGKATVCIFPDLNSGNNSYKAVQQASKTSAVGPIMQGLRMPVNDLSRGCTVEDVVNTAVCTALQAIVAQQANQP
ncbi:hypothetical protein AB1Y20_007678 [Prymnesium parvum]|uniref:Probable acetate kinase n=1 Tax=Prymnesium parvum TaxID=97485 RepID=A0AB34IZK5_PRYPA